MDILLFGIQGSGKGTQARKLAEEFGFYIFEAGGELRKLKESGTELGDKVASYIDNGELVPHEIIMQVTKEAVCYRPHDERILFDGIPRDADQKRDFDTVMRECGREFTCIQFMLDDEEAFQRILSRAEKEGRADDADEEKIRKRMATFHEKTEPVIEAYQAMGMLQEVDADGEVDEVYARLKEVLEL